MPLESGFDNDYGKRFLKILIKDIQKLGGEIIFINDDRKYPSEEEYLVLLYEFKHGLEKYLETSVEPKKLSNNLLILIMKIHQKSCLTLVKKFYASLEKHSILNAKETLKEEQTNFRLNE